MPKAKLKAIRLLKADHDYLKKAFRAFETIDHEDLPAVRALVGQVCDALKVHTNVEAET